jgi:hypothetical protein
VAEIYDVKFFACGGLILLFAVRLRTADCGLRSADCLLRGLWINIQKSTGPDKIHIHIRNIPIFLAIFAIDEATT